MHPIFLNIVSGSAMFYLLLSIFCGTALVVVFKFFPKYKIDTFQAIVVNYWTCFLVGALMLGRVPIDASTFTQPWMPYAAVLGLMFITGFYAVGMTVNLFGLTVATVLQKMSLVISVPFAFLMFSEEVTVLKVIGLLLALTAVVLTNWQTKKDNTENESSTVRKAFVENGGSALLLWIFPIYAFIVSGGIEVVLQYVQDSMLPDSDATNAFSTTLFTTAGVLGTIIAVYLIVVGRSKLKLRNVIAGFVLGLPNYFSIFFLVMAFSYWDKSMVLPINNIAIVSASALLGFIAFREKLSNINWIGVFIAILAIGLISFN